MRFSLCRLALIFLTLTVSSHGLAQQISQTQASEQQGVAQQAPGQAENWGFPRSWKIYSLDAPVFNSKVRIAEVGNPEKPGVLLVHGLGQNGMRDWLPVVPALENDYHLILLDLPGFGGSSGAQGRFSPTNYARVLDTVKNRMFGSQKIAVIGHSMGGAVALRYGSMFSQSVERLVLVDAAGILERSAFLNENAEVRLDISSISERLQGFISSVNDYSGDFISLINSLPDPTGLVQSDILWGAMFANRPNVNAAMALVKENFSSAVFNTQLPTYIIWGGDDRIAPLRTGKLLAAQMPAAELNVIANAGHMPMMTNTYDTNVLIRELLIKDKPRAAVDYIPAGGSEVHCQNRAAQTYEGRYKKIVLENCTGILLRHVAVEQLIVTGSVVELEDVTINGDQLGLEAVNSTVTATNVTITAATTLNVDTSRIDFAGAAIRASETAVSVAGDSQLIFSISKIDSPYFQGFVHGAFQEQNAVFDSRLRN